MDNAITAMTGTQDNPATGVTLQGKKTRKLSLEDICKAANADQVDVIDPYDIAGFEKLLKVRVEEDKLSVIIARHPCQMINALRKPALKINTAACKKCGLCLKLDCPAIIEDKDGNLRIDPVMCVGCELCLKVCKLNALLPI